MNENIFEMGVNYASKKLGLEDIIINYKSLGYNGNDDSVTAVFNPDFFSITVCADWLTQAEEIEILKCAFHETRHAYQRFQVLFPDILKLDVTKETVLIWKEEFERYNHPNNSKDKYLEQEIEKDAIRFSNDLINELLNQE